MALYKDIAVLQQTMAAQLSDSVMTMMQKATAELASSGLPEQALKIGDTMPDFELSELDGGHVYLAELLQETPVVISFYRGAWCPYCNLEMQALQAALPEIEQAGASLIAIAPELPEHAGQTRDKGNLTFPLLHDRDNTLARQCGLVFTLADMLRPVYEGFGIDLQKSQGNDSFELPVPATYIVRPNGVIAFAFVDVDYTRRVEPDRIVEILKTL